MNDILKIFTLILVINAVGYFKLKFYGNASFSNKTIIILLLSIDIIILIVSIFGIHVLRGQ